MATDAEGNKWWDGDWDTLEEAVRLVARDEYYRIIRENNEAAFKREIDALFLYRNGGEQGKYTDRSDCGVERPQASTDSTD